LGDFSLLCALELALGGSYVVILEKASEGRTLRAMKEKWHLQYWVLAGHGRGGALAAELARTLQPKVKGLVLMAAPMPLHVNMVSLNVIVVVLYGQQDIVVTPEELEKSFSRMPGTLSYSLQTFYVICDDLDFGLHGTCYGDLQVCLYCTFRALNTEMIRSSW